MMDQTAYYSAKLNYEIDAWDLRVALNKGDKIVVIDARSKAAYEREHIPSAISLPHRDMCEESTSGLDKSVLYVTYCDGIGCNASTKGALNMSSLGFTVKELMGGLDWWRRDGYETHGAEARPANKNPCAC